MNSQQHKGVIIFVNSTTVKDTGFNGLWKSFIVSFIHGSGNNSQREWENCYTPVWVSFLVHKAEIMKRGCH